MEIPGKGECAKCKKPATRRCTKCIEGLDVDGNPSPTFYCSKDCQNADWTTHKQLCRDTNARKQLYRGCELMQEAYFLHREFTFDFKLANVEFNGNDIVIHEEVSSDIGSLYPFPEHYFTGEQDKRAILTFNKCGAALIHLHEMMKKVFKGIANTSAIQEIFALPGFEPRIVRIRHDGSLEDRHLMHTYLAVALKNGETYAVDLAGAQFGQYRAVMPLHKYEEDYPHLVVKSSDFGTQVVLAQDFMAGKPNPDSPYTVPEGYDHRSPVIQTEVTKALNHVFATAENLNNTTIAEALNEEQSAFVGWKDKILGVARGFMRRCLDEFLSMDPFKEADGSDRGNDSKRHYSTGDQDVGKTEANEHSGTTEDDDIEAVTAMFKACGTRVFRI